MPRSYHQRSWFSAWLWLRHCTLREAPDVTIICSNICAVQGEDRAVDLKASDAQESLRALV